MILGDAIKDALGTDYQRDLHLVGHSMGGQLVLAAGEYLARQYDKGLVGKHLVPSQVTLIDPYMTFNVLSSNSTPPSQNHHFDALLNSMFPFSASEKKFSGKIAI